MTGLTGTRRLTRLALRRDRVTLPAWILGLSFFMGATSALFVSDFADARHLAEETTIVATNAGMRLIGLTSGPSIGGYMLHRDFVTIAVLAAVMSTLAMVRHTRQNEELGRAELVGAAVVGRYAGLAAAVIVTVAANIVLWLALALGMIIAGLPVAGSLLAGASVAGVGLAFTGVAAVACQLASTGRGATGLTAAVLGVSFLVSGIGNMAGTVRGGTRVDSAWPVWLSPIGWGQQTRPFNDGLWWPVVLFVLAFAALVAGAAALVSRRDVGRGMWAERRGHARARRTLLTTPGLVWRLQRGALVGWSIGLLGFGLILGSMSEQVSHVQDTADWYAKTAGSNQLMDAYRASMMSIAGMFVAIYVVQILLRLRVDEAGGTAESVLAGGVSRSRWVLAHVLNAAVGALVLVLLYGVGMGVGGGLALGGIASQTGDMVVAALVQLPGIFVLGAAVIALVALVPRWAAPLSWALLVVSLVIGPMFGEGLNLPQWVRDLSPFTHTPMAPAVAVAATPVLVLVALFLTLAVSGVLVIRRRDLHLPA
ncbi:MAG: ABC transporter permease [Oryzihumus sp.]